jgi:hypothetical protein
MSTRPPKARLRRQKPTDKIVITRSDAWSVTGARRSLERASFFMYLIDDAYRERGRWGRVHYLAVVDAVFSNLLEAIKILDPIARALAKK